MQELRAQIQAQLKLADTLKKISDTAGKKYKAQFSFIFIVITFISGIGDIIHFIGKLLLWF